MPHSLRCRLKGLCYKKILTDREVARVYKALDVADAIEDIKAEIEETIESYVCDKEENTMKAQGMLNAMRMTFEIIDKHISGKE